MTWTELDWVLAGFYVLIIVVVIADIRRSVVVIADIRRSRTVISSIRNYGGSMTSSPQPLSACQHSITAACACAGCRGMSCAVYFRHCTCPACTASCPTPQPVPGTSGWFAGPVPLPRNPRPIRGPGAGIDGFAGKDTRDFGLAVGCVHGIRKWYLQQPGVDGEPGDAGLTWKPGLLQGAMNYRWQPGVNEAKCLNNPNHLPPVEVDYSSNRTCGCGFWGYWSEENLNGVIGGSSRELTVIGVIEGSGRVLIGEKGFRSQKARIIALALPFTIVATLTGTFAPGQELERELARARQHADAWMAVIQDRLQQMYPEAEVFATVRGMLAAVKLGEITPE